MSSPGFLSDIIQILVQFYKRNLGKDPTTKRVNFWKNFSKNSSDLVPGFFPYGRKVMYEFFKDFLIVSHFK